MTRTGGQGRKLPLSTTHSLYNSCIFYTFPLEHRRQTDRRTNGPTDRGTDVPWWTNSQMAKAFLRVASPPPKRGSFVTKNISRLLTIHFVVTVPAFSFIAMILFPCTQIARHIFWYFLLQSSPKAKAFAIAIAFHISSYSIIKPTPERKYGGNPI